MSMALDELVRNGQNLPRLSQSRFGSRIQANSVVAPLANYSLPLNSPLGMPTLGQAHIDTQSEMLEQMTSARRVTLADANLFEQWRSVADEAQQQLQAIMSEFAAVATSIQVIGQHITPSVFTVPAPSRGHEVRPLATQKLEFSPEAVGLLKSVGALDDAKSLSADVYRIVPATTRVATCVVRDPEFGDRALNFVVHTTASVEQVLEVETAVYERLIDSRTFASLPNVAITYEFSN